MSSLCHMDLQNLLLGEVLFFFSGQMTGPTYRPLVRHSNADTPLFQLMQETEDMEDVVEADLYDTQLSAALLILGAEES